MPRCPCILQYVGRTMRTLQVILKEHIGNMKGYLGHSASNHYAQCHNTDLMGTLFVGIDTYVSHWQASHIKREISKLETKWIYNLRVFSPHGLNTEWDLNAFINNS